MPKHVQQVKQQLLLADMMVIGECWRTCAHIVWNPEASCCIADEHASNMGKKLPAIPRQLVH